MLLPHPRPSLFPYTTLFRSRTFSRKVAQRAGRFLYATCSAGITPAISFIPHRSQSPHKGNRSEEHTSELQSRLHLVCRLLLEKKKTLCTSALLPCIHTQLFA